MTNAFSGRAAAKRLFIKTYGCQMNVYDSERIADVLAPLGYAEVDTPENADVVVLNTCHIREKAAEKLYSDLGRLRPHKDAKAAAGGAMTVVVAGCVAQAEGAEIQARAPVVDLVTGPQSYHRLPEMLAGLHRRSGEPLAVNFEPVAKFDALPKHRAVIGPAAFLTVQEGCDKFCSFCVVPYTRGAEWSRPVDQIVEEARALVRSGVREITLLGQNVNAYAGPGPDGVLWGLAALVRHLARIDRLDRIRFTTSHPRDMDEDLIAAFGDCDKLMPYLHLPVQSGSDRILHAMNRRHTGADYVALIERVRRARPDIAISGDFIVGFPGETDADFEATLALIAKVQYAAAFFFKYSPRPGTPASALGGAVSEAVQSERFAILQTLLEDQQLAFNRSQIGRGLDVLIEKPGRNPGQMHGRSPYLQSVHVDASPDLVGQIVRVRITDASRNALAGILDRVDAGAPA